MMHATGLTETKIDANKCNHAASMHYNIGNGYAQYARPNQPSQHMVAKRFYRERKVEIETANVWGILRILRGS